MICENRQYLVPYRYCTTPQSLLLRILVHCTVLVRLRQLIKIIPSDFSSISPLRAVSTACSSWRLDAGPRVPGARVLLEPVGDNRRVSRGVSLEQPKPTPKGLFDGTRHEGALSRAIEAYGGAGDGSVRRSGLWRGPAEVPFDHPCCRGRPLGSRALIRSWPYLVRVTSYWEDITDLAQPFNAAVGTLRHCATPPTVAVAGS
eukprot:COSAG02_NODE_6836_length_3336_cov_4.197405_2_plen_202_part_00